MFEIFDTAGHRDKQGKIEKVVIKKRSNYPQKLIIFLSFQKSKIQKNNLIY